MIKSYKGILPQIDSSCYISDSAVITGKVKVGKNSSIWDCVVARGDIDNIEIGERSNIQDGSILHMNDGIPLKIGNGVTVGHGAKLHGCTIGDNSLIAIGAILLNGSIIGKNCIIGAGAVVTPNTIVPDNSLVLGASGKVKRMLNEEEIEENRNNARAYCELANDYKKNNY